MAGKAVFLDRDGTITQDVGQLTSPEQVRLLPGAAEGVRRLRIANYLTIVVTNQPDLARGLLDERRLLAIHDRLQQELTRHDTRLDAIYYCPYLPGPEAVVEKYRGDSDLSKPRPGMLHQAAGEHVLDLSASWMIGTTPRDIQAGRAAGCRTILLGDATAARQMSADFAAADLPSAVEIIERADHSATSAAPSRGGRHLEQLLEKVLDKLDLAQRVGMHNDFSLAKLGGAVVQMLALGLFGWGLLAILDNQVDQAVVRLLSALFTQILALTLILAHRQR